MCNLRDDKTDGLLFILILLTSSKNEKKKKNNEETPEWYFIDVTQKCYNTLDFKC